MADLRYPLAEHGAGKNAKDFILFSIFEYDGGAVNINKNFALQTTRKKGDAITTIALPIQSTIQDSNTCDWTEDRLDFIKASAAGIGLDFVEKGAKEFKTISQIKAALENKGGTKAVSKGVSTALIEGALNTNIRSRFQGEVMNPNLELLFNGPMLRTFSFGFFMSARDEADATQIKAIINAFKKNMAPKSKQSLFLKSPNIFQIEYKSGTGNKGSLHQSLNKIKTCALQSCSVTYTPGGVYSTFDDPDKTMTAYKLDLQFGELDPIYDSDYDDGHPIGF